jgi:hypothetical protein
MMSFIFKSDIAALQKVCDKWLNEPTNNELHYQPLLPLVMVTFANNASSYPASFPYNTWGSIPYKEVIFSIFVLRVKKMGPIWVSEYLSVTVPYIFVTDGIAMVNGRETFGMPKSYATIQTPDDPKSSGKYFSISAVSAQTFQDKVPFENFPIASIQQISDGDNPTVSEWSEAADAIKAIVKLIFGEGHIEIPGLKLIYELSSLLLQKELPFTALRQVRSISEPDQTVYKAVVEFNAKYKKLEGGGIMHGTYKLTLPQNALYPLAPDLGLTDGQLADAAFFIDWDFVFESGKEIWRA